MIRVTVDGFWRIYQIIIYRDNSARHRRVNVRRRFYRLNHCSFFTGFKLVEPGKLSPKEFDAAANDLVSFLVYLSEPSKLQRLPLGKWVLLFLAVLFLLTYLLKKEYWKYVN